MSYQEHTSKSVIHVNKMKRLPADGAAIGLGGPFPEAGIVQYVFANLNDSNEVVIVRLFRLFTVVDACGGLIYCGTIATLWLTETVGTAFPAIVDAICAGEGRACSGGRNAVAVATVRRDGWVVISWRVGNTGAADFGAVAVAWQGWRWWGFYST